MIIVAESKTCGWGWQQGLAASTAPYVALIADDLECVSSDWSESCIEAADEDMLACPRVYTPTGAIESQGGDMDAIGHLLNRHRKDWSPCDFTGPVHEPEAGRGDRDARLQYCCDIWVSYRGRQLGYDTVLRHGFDLIHHQEQVGTRCRDGSERPRRDGYENDVRGA